MGFQFSTYSVQELSDCGSAFVTHFAHVKFPNNTRERTKTVLGWFCEVMAPGLQCYGHGQPAGHEFLVDQCHATFQLPTLARCERWDQPCEIRLALECEWGKYRSPGETRLMVLDDAWKVAMVRAIAKAVIFPTHKGKDRQERDRREIVDSLQTLRMQSRDDAPWLWVDLPWIESGDYPRNIAFAILS